MTTKTLLQKLEHFEREDFLDLLESLHKKMPEVDLFLSLKLGIIKPIDLLKMYKLKIDKELTVRATRSYKPKISKAKTVIREFKKYSSSVENLLELQYYFCFSLLENILDKQEDAYIPEALKGSAKKLVIAFEKDMQKAKLLVDFDIYSLKKLLNKIEE